MKKLLITSMIILLAFTSLLPYKAQGKEITQSNVEILIPEKVLKNVPDEIRAMLSGKTISKEQYELYIELLESESKLTIDPEQQGSLITPLASKINPSNCQYDLGSNYCFRIDPANSSTKEPYHVHIYQKKVHYYCMRLDNFKPCDANKNKVEKFNDLPDSVKEGVMGNKKVQERVKVYNPNAQKWSDSIPFIKTLAISVIVVALVVTPIPGDEYVAWAYFLRAIA
jgi:hypothetical protein